MFRGSLNWKDISVGVLLINNYTVAIPNNIAFNVEKPGGIVDVA